MWVLHLVQDALDAAVAGRETQNLIKQRDEVLCCSCVS